MSDEKKVDGYWLRMGSLMVDTLSRENIVSTLDEQQRKTVAEYLAGSLEDAHEMGMRLGESRGRFLCAMKSNVS